MIRSHCNRITTLTAGALSAVSVAAHDGHGGHGTHHWHATDVWGFIVLAVIVAGAIAWWRGRS
jgi:hypothetical protein